MSTYEYGEPMLLAVKPLETPEHSIDVFVTPVEQSDYSMLDADYEWGEFSIRDGVQIAVAHGGDILQQRHVWQSGRFLPRPFYEKRLNRALRQAERFAANLAISHV